LVVGDYEWGGFVDDLIFLALNQVLPKKRSYFKGVDKVTGGQTI